MLYLNLRTNMSNKILDWQLNGCTQPYFNFIFCCCSLDQHREYYTKVKGNKYSDILIPYAHFTSKNRISFPAGLVSQLPSVSPVLQRESNVSSFVFPVQCCQILFELSEKCVWWLAISASALGAAAAPPVAAPLPPAPLLLVQGCGLLVLWGEWPFPHTIAHVSHPGVWPPTLPGPCCSGYATVFNSAHQGFILLHRWWVEDLTVPLSGYPLLNSSLIRVSTSCFLSLSTYASLLIASWKSQGTSSHHWFSSLKLLMLYPSVLSKSLFDFSQNSHPWIGCQEPVPQLGFFFFFVFIFSQLKYSSDLGFNFGWT